MSDVLAGHDALLTSEIEGHGSMVVGSRGKGDSIFAVFVRARDATAAAYVAQRAILRQPWPLDLSIKVELREHEHDYYGPVANGLDNCEHLLVGTAALVQWLLSSPGVKVSATSREALNLAGARTFQVPPLPIPVDNAGQCILTGCPSVESGSGCETRVRVDG